MIKVYKFAIHPPTENAQLVRQQLQLAYQYRRTLFELSRKERAEMRELQSVHGSIPALTEAAKKAADACEEAYAAIKKHKAQQRTRDVPDELRAAHVAAKADKKTASAALYGARAALREDAGLIAKRDALVGKYAELRKQARAACGVYWGTYLLIERAHEQANQKTPLWNGTLPQDPSFPRWDGGGQLAVQIQNGAPFEKIRLGTSLHARVAAAPLPPGADPNSKKSQKKCDYYKTFQMRVGSAPDGKPVWATWRMVAHRAIPDDAVIRWVSIRLRRVGPREEWTACFTAELPSEARVLDGATNRVAIDFGWRVVEGGIRLATWRSDSGEDGFLLMNEHLIGRFKKVNDLCSIRDKSFDAAQAALLASLATLTLPEWFPRNIAQWESKKRLAGLRFKWADNRFDGDAAAFDALVAWEKQDRHLWEWECFQREKNYRIRRDIYRKFAAGMARRFHRLVIDDLDLSEIAEMPSAENQKDLIQAARSNRQMVAASELRNALVASFRGDVDKSPTEWSTRTCFTCKSVEDWDKARKIEHTCSQCGSHWDQDQNKTKNLLGYERPRGEENTEVARNAENANDDGDKKESRWTKARRLHGERKQRMVVAREADANAAE